MKYNYGKEEIIKESLNSNIQTHYNPHILQQSAKYIPIPPTNDLIHNPYLSPTSQMRNTLDMPYFIPYSHSTPNNSSLYAKQFLPNIGLDQPSPIAHYIHDMSPSRIYSTYSPKLNNPNGLSNTHRNSYKLLINPPKNTSYQPPFMHSQSHLDTSILNIISRLRYCLNMYKLTQIHEHIYCIALHYSTRSEFIESERKRRISQLYVESYSPNIPKSYKCIQQHSQCITNNALILNKEYDKSHSDLIIKIDGMISTLLNKFASYNSLPQYTSNSFQTSPKIKQESPDNQKPNALYTSSYITPLVTDHYSSSVQSVNKSNTSNFTTNSINSNILGSKEKQESIHTIHPTMPLLTSTHCESRKRRISSDQHNSVPKRICTGEFQKSPHREESQSYPLCESYLDMLKSPLELMIDDNQSKLDSKSINGLQVNKSTKHSNLVECTNTCSKKKRTRIPKEAKEVMNQWLVDNDSPYPDVNYQKQISSKYDLTQIQVNKWFRNQRVRRGITRKLTRQSPTSK